MAKILPFRGILYNKRKVGDYKKVVSPPYDVISKPMMDDLYKKSPYNVVRIILGKEDKNDTKSENKYTRAASFLNKWLKDKILIADAEPSIYVYEQEYLHKSKKLSRVGFISLMKIEDPKSGLVLPHEFTFSKPKEDRLNLMRATKANTEPIFCVFQDDDDKVTNALKKYIKNSKPLIGIHFEGIRNKIWALKDTRVIKIVVGGLAKKQVFIADGHHRYEVALQFRNEMREKVGEKNAKNFDNLMVYFSSLSEDNLTILSTHRVIKDLGLMSWDNLQNKIEPYFRIKEAKSKKDMFDSLEKVKKGYYFGVYFKNRKFYILTLKDASILDKVIKTYRSKEWQRLQVTALHHLVFDYMLHIDKSSSNDENIIYTRDENEAVELVNKGFGEIAFFPIPTKMAEVKDIAKKGDRMPHKSTYFYPKPLSGLVMNKL